MFIDPTIVVVLAAAAVVTPGSLCGAWMAGVALWKGPAIVIPTVAVFEGGKLLLMPSAVFASIPLLIDLALLLVIAGLFARLLGVSAKAAAVIVISSFLGLLVFGALSLLVVPLEQVNLGSA